MQCNNIHFGIEYRHIIQYDINVLLFLIKNTNVIAS